MAVLLAPIAAAAVRGVSAVGRERHRLPDTISEPLHHLAQGGIGREEADEALIVHFERRRRTGGVG